MNSWTIKNRIIASLGLVAMTLSGFMGIYFPLQASNMGNRLIADSALTVSELFTGSVAPAFDVYDFGGDDMIATAVQGLRSRGSNGAEGRAGAGRLSEAKRGSREGSGSELQLQAKRILVSSVAVLDPEGRKLDGFGNLDLASIARNLPDHVVFEDADDGHGLRVTMPARAEGRIVGYTCVTYSKDHVIAQVDQYKARALFIAIASFLLILVLGYFVGNSISSSVRRAARAMDELADGNGDLTARLEERGRDELTELSRGFNLFVAKVERIVAQVMTSTHAVVESSNAIALSARETAENAREESDQVRGMFSAIEELTATTAELARKASEVAGGAREAGDHASEGGWVIGQAVESIRAIATTVNDASASISRLGQQSEEIGEIIGVIDEIADQTNLLALNAAIEAARAGEHGRGFAVVADEVRRLAERTTKATGEVRSSIVAIQSETRAVVDRMVAGEANVSQGVTLSEQAGASLQSIVTRARDVADMISEIAAASEEQSSTSVEIQNTIERIDALVKRGSESALGYERTAAELSELSHHLLELVGVFEVGTGAEKAA